MFCFRTPAPLVLGFGALGVPTKTRLESRFCNTEVYTPRVVCLHLHLQATSVHELIGDEARLEDFWGPSDMKERAVAEVADQLFQYAKPHIITRICPRQWHRITATVV